MFGKVKYDKAKLLMVVLPIALICVGFHYVAETICGTGSWCGTIKMVAFVGPLFGALWGIGWLVKNGRFSWILENNTDDEEGG